MFVAQSFRKPNFGTLGCLIVSASRNSSRLQRLPTRSAPIQFYSSVQPQLSKDSLKIQVAQDFDSDFYQLKVLTGEKQGKIYFLDGTETIQNLQDLLKLPNPKIYDSNGVLLSYSTPVEEIFHRGFTLVSPAGTATAAAVSVPSRRPAEVIDLLAQQRVREELERSGLHDVEWEQYMNLCHREGLTPTQALALSRTLHEAGVLWRLPNSLILDTENVARSVDQIFLNVGSRKKENQEREAKIAELRTQLGKLEGTLDSVTQRAQKQTKRFVWGSLAYLFAQTGTISYGVWFYAGWDIMEPVTFGVTLSIMLGGFAYHVHHREDYNYEHLGQWLTNRSKDRLLRKVGFDMTEYKALKAKLAALESVN